jgi:hypothetical protein
VLGTGTSTTILGIDGQTVVLTVVDTMTLRPSNNAAALGVALVKLYESDTAYMASKQHCVINLTPAINSISLAATTTAMSYLNTVVCTTPSSKRKHLDEEAQFYADDEDCWKRPRTCAPPSLDAEMMMEDGDTDAIQDDEAAAEVSSTKTEGSASPDVINYSLNDDDGDKAMEIEIERYSPPSGTIQIHPGATGNELSWSMHDLKALRRQSPQALQKTSEARREVMRVLWRPPSWNPSLVNR